MTLAETDRAPLFSLADPLDWRQFRALLWEALELFPPDATGKRAWDELAGWVNDRCDGSEPRSGDSYRAVASRLEAAYPELGEGAPGPRVWTRVLYEAVHELADPTPVFMNLGYISAEAGGAPRTLEPEDEMQAPFIEIYRRAVSGVEIEGAAILEVGCGCGGGASYVMRYHRPASLIGVDLLERNVEAASRHDLPGLRFEVGDAQALRFADGRFDGVINVESSHSYADFAAFLGEVERVLVPGGHFFFIDHRPLSGEWGDGRSMAELEEALAASGLAILETEDLTEGVVLASEMLHEPKAMMLDALGIEGHDRRHLEEILHLRGSRNHERLAAGEWRYRRWLLRKEGEAS